MKIELTHIKIADLVDGYCDSQENGVVGYHGLLDIRPKYQREFVYQEKQRNAVIDTISKGFPLNVMYWCKKEDGGFEVLDGQQRTISICKFMQGEFMVNWDDDLKAIHNLTATQRKVFLDYELLVYICEGTDEEKLDWFRVINIAGEKLEEQEIRNAVYAGSWVTEAKRHFSKSGCPAKGLSDGYVNKKWIRQEGLQTAIQWVCMPQKLTIEQYMAAHQNDTQCSELWMTFSNIVNWAKYIFPKKRKELTSIDWGKIYWEFKDKAFDPKELEQLISELMKDGEVQNKAGIYWYVLSGNEQYLNLRMFDDKIKAEKYEEQGGRCANPDCKEPNRIWDIREMEADHIVPWRLGGLTTKDNCQMLCRHCNRTKSGK